VKRGKSDGSPSGSAVVIDEGSRAAHARRSLCIEPIARLYQF
jgi:hypothetical protein